MLKLLVPAFAVLGCFAADANAVIALLEDFEDTTITYSATSSETSDGSGDFFGRVDSDGISVGSFYDLFESDGTTQRTEGFFAAMDTDANGTGDPNAAAPSLTWNNIDIAGLTSLLFSAEFAEDDQSTNQDWDPDTSVIVAYRFDSDVGAFIDLFTIESSGGTNTEPAVDTNLDGIGDGTLITESFALFSSAIPGTGSTLDLRITMTLLDSGDEDIAFDNVQITAIPEPSAFLFGGLISCVLGMNYARKRRG